MLSGSGRRHGERTAVDEAHALRVGRRSCGDMVAWARPPGPDPHACMCAPSPPHPSPPLTSLSLAVFRDRRGHGSRSGPVGGRALLSLRSRTRPVRNVERTHALAARGESSVGVHGALCLCVCLCWCVFERVSVCSPFARVVCRRPSSTHVGSDGDGARVRAHVGK